MIWARQQELRHYNQHHENIRGDRGRAPPPPGALGSISDRRSRHTQKGWWPQSETPGRLRHRPGHHHQRMRRTGAARRAADRSPQRRPSPAPTRRPAGHPKSEDVRLAPCQVKRGRAKPPVVVPPSPRENPKLQASSSSVASSARPLPRLLGPKDICPSLAPQAARVGAGGGAPSPACLFHKLRPSGCQAAAAWMSQLSPHTPAQAGW